LRPELSALNPEQENARDRMNRLRVAFAVFVVLGLLTYTTISDERIRMATFAILALFAVKTWLHRNDERPDQPDDRLE
jgi:hypothetical protein